MVETHENNKLKIFPSIIITLTTVEPFCLGVKLISIMQAVIWLWSCICQFFLMSDFKLIFTNAKMQFSYYNYSILRGQKYCKQTELSHLHCFEQWKFHFLFKWWGIAYFAAAVAQWGKAWAPQAKGWVYDSQPWQTKVVKTGSGSSTAKHSAIGVSVMGPRRWPL